MDLRTGDLGAESTDIEAEPLPIDEPDLGKPLVGDRSESARPVDRSLTEGAVGEAGLSTETSSCKIEERGKLLF